MDELSLDMLAKVASYLSYKDINSMHQTSKFCNKKLEKLRERELLPKIPLTLTIDSTRNQISLEVTFKFEEKAWRRKRAYLIEPGETATDELTEEEKKALVVSFYKTYHSGNLSQHNETFGGRKEALARHFETMESFGTIKEIYIYQKEDDNMVCEELARLIHSSRSRIDYLRIRSKKFHQSQINLFVACKPSCLSLCVPQLPDEFYKLSVVRRLPALFDQSQEKTVYNFSSLSAKSIEISGNHGITIDDVRQLMSQWAEAKREVDGIDLDLNETLTQEDVRDWMENLDRQLVRVELHVGRELNNLAQFLLSSRMLSRTLFPYYN